MTVAVGSVDDAPVAVADAVSGTEDTALVLLASEVLGNDSDADGDALTIASVTSGSGGTAVLNADGSITFTPDAEFSGTATFSYEVSDGAGPGGTATVTVAVGSVDDAATIAGSTSGEVREDDFLSASGQLIVQDPDIDQGRFFVPSSTELVGAFGVFTFDATTGYWSYNLSNTLPAVQTLGANQRLFDHLEVTSLDGSATEIITVEILGTDEPRPILTGTSTKDTIVGSSLGEDIYGLAGDDNISGAGGGDSIYGGGGNDTISAAFGDRIWGDDGADTISLNDLPTLVDGGTGTDTLRVNGSFVLDPLVFANIERYKLSSGSFADFRGFAAPVVANADAGAQVIVIGGAGADNLTGSSGADTIRGSSGNDNLTGFGGADLLYGEDGNDLLYGGQSSRMYGGSGDDSLTIADGSPDTLNGGDGNDKVRILDSMTFGDTHVVGVERFDLSAAGIRVDFSAISRGLTIRITTAAGAAAIAGNFSDSIVGSVGGDVIQAGGGNDYIDGAGGEDKLTAGDGDDFIYGRAGDIIQAGAGNDIIVLAGKPFQLEGGSGTDKMRLEASQAFHEGDFSGIERIEVANGVVADFSSMTSAVSASTRTGDGSTIIGGQGNDSFAGSTKADVLTGGNGADYLTGGNGDDTLTGGWGRDVLYGNSGRDTFVFDAIPIASQDRDSIKDFQTGIDQLAFRSEIFASLSGSGTLSADQFAIGTAATTMHHRIVYNPLTGALSYDPDGVGSSVSFLIAAFEGAPVIVNSDFVLI